MLRTAKPARCAMMLVASALALAVVGPCPRASADSPDVVARVNGSPITRQMVQEVVKSVMVGQTRPPSSKEVQDLIDAALESLIELELVYQEARSRKLTVSEADIDAEIRRTRSRFATDADFAAALHSRGLSQAQLREDTKKTLLANQLLSQIIRPDAVVGDDEIRAFYEGHLEEFDRPAQARVRHIVFPVPPDASITEKIGARGEAERVRKQILAGADFEALARQYSSDATTAKNGGDLGFVQPGELGRAAGDAVSDLPVGGVSEVIETREGCEILQITERRSAGRVPFTEAQESIGRALAEAQQQERQQDFVTELRRQAKVERVPDSEFVGGE